MEPFLESETERSHSVGLTYLTNPRFTLTAPRSHHRSYIINALIIQATFNICNTFTLYGLVWKLQAEKYVVTSMPISLIVISGKVPCSYVILRSLVNTEKGIRNDDSSKE